MLSLRKLVLEFTDVYRNSLNASETFVSLGRKLCENYNINIQNDFLGRGMGKPFFGYKEWFPHNYIPSLFVSLEIKQNKNSRNILSSFREGAGGGF